MIGKHVLVWGMARSGVAAAKLLNDAGGWASRWKTVWTAWT